MNLLKLLEGKKTVVLTDVGVSVELEIKKVEQNNHSENLAPATRENDWWPPTRDWTTYTVHFTNGYSKTYSSLDEIDVY